MGVKKRKTAQAAADATTVRELKAFYHGLPTDDFSGVRYYWPAGDGDRESIAVKILKKRRPASPGVESDTAAKVEVLLRRDVGQDYTDPDFLIRSYEENLATGETAALAQVTMRFPNATNLHGPYELARSWLRSHYVERLGVPTIAILHAPYLAGSDAPIHVHGLILMKTRSAFAWLATHRGLASDVSFRAAQKAWQDFLRK